MELTHNSLMTKLNYDESGNVIAVRCKEKQTISSKAMNQLTQFPDEYQRLTITDEAGVRLKEVFGQDEIPENGFKVNYNSGIVFFNQAQIGELLTFEYLGKGMDLISTNRVFHKYQSGNECIVETLDEITDNFIQSATDIVDRGNESIQHIIETETLMKENEAQRVEAENGRVQAEINRESSEVERQNQENNRIQAEIDREATFDLKMSEWELEHQTQIETFDRRFGDEVDGWKREFDEAAQGCFNQQSTKVDQAITTWGDEFDQKVNEWESLVPTLGIIDDSSTTPHSTWSSEKVQREILGAGVVDNQPDTIARRDELGNLHVENVLLGVDGMIGFGRREEYGIVDQLYTTGLKGYVPILTSDDVSASADAEKIVKRDPTGKIEVSGIEVSNGGVIEGSGEQLIHKPSSSGTGYQLWTSKDLKHVESGNWTPKPMVENGAEIPVATYSAKYSVVGNTVFASGWFTWDQLPSNVNGRLIVRGFPFTNNGNATVGSIGFRTGANLPTDAYHIFCEMPSIGTTGVPELRFYCAKGATGVNYNCSNLASSGEIHFAITYFTN